ncbi:helix-turn-helix domain-containing protein [Salmonella enterica subsp. enterica serovar Typhimurium]
MPAFEWVHVQLHQQKGMISLSPPTICNSAGLEAARARGRLGGRKPKLQKKDIREIRALLKDGSIPVSDVARRYGVSRTTIYNHVGVVNVQNSRGD